MLNNPSSKYTRSVGIALPDRQWPNKHIEQPPVWMSTDLRDGNQALIDPMSIPTKLRFFKELVAIGFKEIEVGFPAASEIDFQFVRLLIEENLIPDDVTIEVMTQARYELIEKTLASVKNAKQVILHIYNPLAPQFRRIVYNTDKEGVKKIAVQATQWCRDLTALQPETHWIYQYSPETFSSTEIDFAKEVCDAVVDTWKPTPEHKMILNLPATVEMNTPNTYADQIEWMHRNLQNRESIILSIHPHNDRGTAIAAAELAVMAGAERIEGCLFGNGERTGNVDLVTLALNLYSQGIHPGLDFSDIDRVRQLVEDCNQLPVHPRHPYAGELVYTAFSGSHQDAIKKGFAVQSSEGRWEVPYLPIDPSDLSRSYDAVVRVNSQSGKGGISYLLLKEEQLQLPRRLQIEFSGIVQRVSDSTGREVKSREIVQLFYREYFDSNSPFKFMACTINESQGNQLKLGIDLHHTQTNTLLTLEGMGNGPIDAATSAFREHTLQNIFVVDYHEHSIGEGSDATSVCYVEVKVDSDKTVFGAGRDENIINAAIKAIVSAVNRAQAYRQSVTHEKSTTLIAS